MKDDDIKSLTGYVEEAELEAIVDGEKFGGTTSWACVTLSWLICPTTACTKSC
ncbi:class II lanthipeptide, LchA2/BrtA2 family [Streptomyces phyllanthi]|uniref:class II lanthipeptide, LchA2/BrtA2 family n=1 Tax=Streptomyces phyllanthi TaxID=1803180 RepID=UPI00188418C7|nr:class II lanthipeptide, LchA2/BrtA2 family [Streptomyces phyllanthi]